MRRLTRLVSVAKLPIAHTLQNTDELAPIAGGANHNKRITSVGTVMTGVIINTAVTVI